MCGQLRSSHDGPMSDANYVEAAASVGLPAEVDVPCCYYKPGCGNTTIYFEAYFDRRTGEKRYRYHRDNDDTYSNFDVLNPSLLAEYLRDDRYQPWPEKPE